MWPTISITWPGQPATTTSASPAISTAAPRRPARWKTVSKYPELFAELIRRGWRNADLKKLAGENMLRTFGQAERVAGRLQRERPASTATIATLDGKKEK
ncbi:membrane dipeptidase [Duganella sp. HH101]|uniref:membrane dipeptidase n=1 Tax=Duganella sp. HH101 TaxID=1781066 RepID=UPI0035A67256